MLNSVIVSLDLMHGCHMTVHQACAHGWGLELTEVILAQGDSSYFTINLLGLCYCLSCYHACYDTIIIAIIIGILGRVVGINIYYIP